MTYPFKSFALAILIWILLLFFFNKFLFPDFEIVPVSLEIEGGELNYKFHEKQQSALEKNKNISKKHDLSNSSAKNSATKEVVAIENPLPIIPDELRSEAFNSSAIVRFYITENGEVIKVELIKPCANPKLNQLLLKSLRKWRFTASNIANTKDITVNFEVK